MKSKGSNKKIYLVNRDFQLRHSRAAVFVGVLSTILTAVLILYPLFIFKILVIPQFVPLPFMLAMGFAALVNMGFIAGAGILLTHRIAGPMYSMVRQMRRVSAGILRSPVALRKNDDLRFLVRNYNDLINGLVTMGESDLKKIEAIEGIARKFSGSPGFSDLDTAVTELKNELKRRLHNYPNDYIPADNEREVRG